MSQYKKSNIIDEIIVYKKTFTDLGEIKKEEGIKNSSGDYLYDNQQNCIYEFDRTTKTKKNKIVVNGKKVTECIPYIHTETKKITNYKDNDMFKWKLELQELKEKYPDPDVYYKKVESLRNKEVKTLIFDEYLNL